MTDISRHVAPESEAVLLVAGGWCCPSELLYSFLPTDEELRARWCLARWPWLSEQEQADDRYDCDYLDHSCSLPARHDGPCLCECGAELLSVAARTTTQEMMKR
jgi:hypothetical protein